MAKGFQKLKINSAVKSNSSINLNFDHETTMDFGQFVPVMSLPLLPVDKVSVKMNSFTRLAPLVFPTYGTCLQKYAALYVPYYQLVDNIEGYFQNQTYYKGKATWMPQINAASLVNMFRSTDLSEVVASNVDSVSENYNFVYIGENGQKVFRRFTTKGKYFYKVLRCLGYDLLSCYDFSNSSQEVIYLNALPILSFFKCYNDWFSNSVLYNNSVLTKFLGVIYEGDRTFRYSVPGTQNSSFQNLAVLQGSNISWPALYLMLDSIRITYEKDYITSAWAQPNSPFGTDNVFSETMSQPNYLDETDYRHLITANSKDTYLEKLTDDGDSTAFSKISARGLRLLQSFDNYLRRKNYVGTRAVNRILAQFGIKPSEQKSMFAEFLQLTDSQIKVGDVTQTSATVGNEKLGSYAGKGIDDTGISFNFDSRDYGHLFVMSYITVKPMYSRGFDREVLKTNVYDFYNPEFDGETPQAIPVMEVYNKPSQVTSDDPYSVFGFTEKYNEYRFKRDQITGDFELYPSLMPWHFERDLSFVRSNGVKAQSANVTQYIPNSNGVYEYDRIFADDGTISGIDHFFTTMQFNLRANRPILNNSATAQLGNGDLEVDRLGEQMN